MRNKTTRSDRNNRQDRRSQQRPDRKNDPIIIININWEDLVHKNDEEIRSLSDRLNKNLRLARTKKDEKSSKLIEKEICYIQREIDQRDKRKKAHFNFRK
ncbi:MAG: hypothetical protein CMB77_03900 [Euryarchaeota archaeon]|nr:hypothetical protein [Euryarchaeota archaeon]|tara:strand:+ start:35306 stop:35605 length:300 start_codon:yes stop_codon:yes gene_type:complete